MFIYLLKILAVFSIVAAPAMPALANVIGNGTQNFAPTSGFHDFATVNSSDTLPARSYHLGLFLNNATNTLPYADGVDDADRRSNQILGADMMIGYGITDRLHLGFSAPFVVSQQMDDQDNTHSRFAEEGNTEFRFHGKFKLVGKRDKSGLALILNATMDRTVDNPHRGENLGLTYIPEIAGDLKMGRTIFSANLGYKIQDTGSDIEGSLFEPFGNKYLYSIAFGVLTNKNKTKPYIEMFGSRPVASVATESDRSIESREAIVGVKHMPQPDLALNVGAGTELLHGVSTPDLRIFAGVNYLIRPEPKKRKIIAKRKPKKKRKKRRKRRRAKPLPLIDTSEDTVALQDLDLMNEPAPVIDPMVPSTAPIPAAKPDEVIVINDINFIFDSDHEVFKGGLAEIDKVASYVAAKQNADKIVIEGHTCHMGTNNYNEDLSFRRAKTIRRHLIKKYGFSPSQVIAVGFGETRPKVSNMTERGKRHNRRVEFKIYYSETLSQAGY